jgi:hypothetical protein
MPPSSACRHLLPVGEKDNAATSSFLAPAWEKVAQRAG